MLTVAEEGVKKSSNVKVGKDTAAGSEDEEESSSAAESSEESDDETGSSESESEDDVKGGQETAKEKARQRIAVDTSLCLCLLSVSK